MKGSVKIMDPTGHATLEYDTEKPEGYTNGKTYLPVSEVQQRVEHAIRDQRMTAFAGSGTQTPEQIKGIPKLDEHDEVVLVHPIAGG